MNTKGNVKQPLINQKFLKNYKIPQIPEIQLNSDKDFITNTNDNADLPNQQNLSKNSTIDQRNLNFQLQQQPALSNPIQPSTLTPITMNNQHNQSQAKSNVNGQGAIDGFQTHSFQFIPNSSNTNYKIINNLPNAQLEISKYSNSQLNDVSLSNPLNFNSHFANNQIHSHQNSNQQNNTFFSTMSKSYIPSSIIQVSEDKNEKLFILEKLIGNSREAKELRNGYLKMILQPENIDKRRLKDKPYMAKLCNPDQQVQLQAKWHPSLTDKLTMIEQVVDRQKYNRSMVENQTKTLNEDVTVNMMPSLMDQGVSFGGGVGEDNEYIQDGLMTVGQGDIGNAQQQSNANFTSGQWNQKSSDYQDNFNQITTKIIRNDIQSLSLKNSSSNMTNFKASNLSKFMNHENPKYKEIVSKIDTEDIKDRRKVKKKSRFCLEESYIKRLRNKSQVTTNSSKKHRQTMNQFVDQDLQLESNAKMETRYASQKDGISPINKQSQNSIKLQAESTDFQNMPLSIANDLRYTFINQNGDNLAQSNTVQKKKYHTNTKNSNNVLETGAQMRDYFNRTTIQIPNIKKQNQLQANLLNSINKKDSLISIQFSGGDQSQRNLMPNTFDNQKEYEDIFTSPKVRQYQQKQMSHTDPKYYSILPQIISMKNTSNNHNTGRYSSIDSSHSYALYGLDQNKTSMYFNQQQQQNNYDTRKQIQSTNLFGQTLTQNTSLDRRENFQTTGGQIRKPYYSKIQGTSVGKHLPKNIFNYAPLEPVQVRKLKVKTIQ
eukprot:403364999